MIPLRDNLPTGKTPVVTYALAVANVLATILAHGGLWLLAGNMLFLWIFGPKVENALGRVKFAGLYLLGGAAALALQLAIDPSTDMAAASAASGAVAAVLGGYFLLNPRAKIVTVVLIPFFFTTVELPAMVLLVLWFAMQALIGGAASFAHIGGFAVGLVAIRLFAGAKRLQRPQERFARH